MKRLPIAGSVVFALLIFAAHAETYTARVTRVIDGDTIEVQRGTRKEIIRLQAIDAPEKRQRGGKESTEALRRSVEGKTVTVESQKSRDKYGRTVGKVTANGRDAGLDQIQQGQARHFKKYEKKQSAPDRREYAKTDRKAAPLRKSQSTGKKQRP